jgi:DNA-binding IclR family transcriptional regulator
MTILLFLAGRAYPVPAMVIARECSLPKSTTYHILGVLRRRQFVTYYEGPRLWGLGVATFEVGSAYPRSVPLERLARPILADMAESAGEAAHLAVLDGNEVVYLDRQQPPNRPVRLVSEVGAHVPAHLTAVGRAMLARLDRRALMNLYPGMDLPTNRTGRGPTTMRALLAELADLSDVDVAAEDGLTTDGISCLGVALLGPDRLPAAALGLSFRTRVHDESSRATMSELLVSAVRLLSRQLGWEGRDVTPAHHVLQAFECMHSRSTLRPPANVVGFPADHRPRRESLVASSLPTGVVANRFG